MLLLIALLCGTFTYAQSKSKTLHFKKGEVLDILLFTGKPALSELFPRYKETAFAFALETGYQPQPLLSIAETTQGGIQPSSFVFGKWNDLSSRERFLNNILTKVPDFHEQRRAMWSSFYLAYYPMAKEVSFEIDPGKIVVATAYWEKDASKFKLFKKEWLKKAKNKGGKVLLELTDAKSSVGYMYKPDLVILTEWNTREDFDAFYKENLQMSEEGIQNVNQFIIK